ncbi:hypothetical protein [Phaeobacter sp. HF9A]|uniref:hypothetical protein n=1 Tax=Phaeobacter sp. HF9A TaxID=2721561 RepID=UPI001431A050|nr:hypothetical protein [Phaeobacter sp. HF9A]NIZ14407.1 hypothetical protein [Phaeobacter sp. HF9A]
MSEPVTHAEIEDVLSSIRRLVSETGREAEPLSRVAPKPAKAATRLVLTPALRVSDTQPEAEAETPAAQVSDPSIIATPSAEAPQDLGPADSQPEDQSHAEYPPMPQVAARKNVTASETAVEDPVVEAPWRDPEATLFEAAEGGDADSPAAVPLRSSRVAAVVRRIAELETEGRDTRKPEAQLNGRPVPDLNEDDIEPVPPSGQPVDTIQWEDHVQVQSPQEAQADADDPVQPAGEDAQDLVQSSAEELALEKATSQEDFLDEDSLRELVADIVREELQGPLGERITRNVRKLVRREIQRALAAQDLL